MATENTANVSAQDTQFIISAGESPAYQCPVQWNSSGDPAAVLRLLDEWMADESGYDEEVWPELKANLERNRMGERRLFRD